MSVTEQPPVRRPVFPDLVLMLALAAFLGCLHHAVRADRPLFTAPRNAGYAGLLSIAGAEVRSLLGKPGVVIVDARPEQVFVQGTIPTSLSLPLHSQIEQDMLKTIQEASRVIVFCSNEHCNASKELGVILKSRGVQKVEVFAGGMEEWKKAGYPISSSAPNEHQSFR